MVPLWILVDGPWETFYQSLRRCFHCAAVVVAAVLFVAALNVLKRHRFPLLMSSLILMSWFMLCLFSPPFSFVLSDFSNLIKRTSFTLALTDDSLVRSSRLGVGLLLPIGPLLYSDSAWMSGFWWEERKGIDLEIRRRFIYLLVQAQLLLWITYYFLWWRLWGVGPSFVNNK